MEFASQTLFQDVQYLWYEAIFWEGTADIIW